MTLPDQNELRDSIAKILSCCPTCGTSELHACIGILPTNSILYQLEALVQAEILAAYKKGHIDADLERLKHGQ